MATEKDSTPNLVTDLSGGGQLDHNQLKRIEKNPFIINDGKLPV